MQGKADFIMGVAGPWREGFIRGAASSYKPFWDFAEMHPF